MLTDKMQEVIDTLDSFKSPPISRVSPEIARQLPTPTDAVMGVMTKHLTKKMLGPVEEVGKVEHKLIPGPDGEILLRVYSPKGEGPFPILVYYHGGGWVIANLDTYDSSCRALCNAADFIVVSVAYRQAPEHKFPAPVEDAYAAYQWVSRNAEQINGTRKCIAVGGESAGGNLATVVCLKARDEGFRIPNHQLLVYPVTNFSFDTASYDAFENAKPLNKEMMYWFWGHYLDSAEDALSPYASPLNADLADLPPATVILAEEDPLFTEGEAYADKLANSGVDVTLAKFEGVTHEFFGMTALLPEAKEAVELAADRLRNMVEDDWSEEMHPLLVPNEPNIAAPFSVI